jgi:hypothetical protein
MGGRAENLFVGIRCYKNYPPRTFGQNGRNKKGN